MSPVARLVAAAAAAVALVCAAAAVPSANDLLFDMPSPSFLRSRRLGSASDTSGKQYGLLFDAGSSGTRLSIYSWDQRVFSTLPPGLSVPLERDVITQRSAPGIDKPSGRAALIPMLKQAVAYFASIGVTEDRFQSFPVFLTATAGMRILDAASRNAALESVRDIIVANSPFMFQRPWARVISGEAEGIYGWLAANDLMGTLFESVTFSDGSSSLFISNSTIGSIDLGGASTQIAFLPPDGGDLLAGCYPLALTNTARANAFVHSHLYYGAAEGTARINELVLSQYAANHQGSTVTNGEAIDHPCFLTATPAAYTSYTSTTVFPGLTVSFQGTSDFASCYSLATKLMLRETQCLTDPKPTPKPVNGAVTVGPDASFVVDGIPVINSATWNNDNSTTCALDGVYQPPLPMPNPSGNGNGSPGTILAFSFYSYLYPFLGVASGSPVSSLLTAVQSFCSLDFATANATYFSRTTVPAAIPSYCLTGAYATALLAVGFKVPLDVPNVVMVNATATITYANGAMMSAVNQLSWTYQQSGGGDSAQVAALTKQLDDARAVAGALGAFLILSVGVATWSFWRRKKEEARREKQVLAAVAAVGGPAAAAAAARKLTRGLSTLTISRQASTLNNSYAVLGSGVRVPQPHSLPSGPSSVVVDSSSSAALHTGLLGAADAGSSPSSEQARNWS